MPAPRPEEISKARVRRSFDRAAETYAPEAGLQRALAEALVAWEPPPARERLPILDLGAGTGFVSAALLRTRPGARIVAVDLSERMLRAFPSLAGARRVVADAERLPFADGAFGEALSGLALQWAPDLGAALAEAGRVLAPGGTLRLSLFVEGTLGELRRGPADSPEAVHPFRSLTDVRAAAGAAGLRAGREEVLRRTIPFESRRALFAHLRRIGARSALEGGGGRAGPAAPGAGGPFPVTFVAAFLRAEKK